MTGSWSTLKRSSHKSGVSNSDGCSIIQVEAMSERNLDQLKKG